MKISLKFVLAALFFSIVSFLLSRVIWPDLRIIDILMSRVLHSEAGALSSMQLPLFVLLSLLESITFGVGVAFAFFGWKNFKTLMPGNRKAAFWCFVSIIWLLVSWWPHDNMHVLNAPDNLAGLLKIEYAFHVTLMIAGLILARNLGRLFRRAGDPGLEVK